MRVCWGIVLFGMIAGSCIGDDGDDCGDGVCSIGESTSTCAIDCPVNGPRCGDGICNGNETSLNCVSDCPIGACSAGADTCMGETICIAGRCEAAFPRIYEIRNVSVSVPTTNPNNQSDWDVGGGAPDMYLSYNGTAWTTPVADQFSASWPGPFEVSLIAGASLRVVVYDEDIAVDDAVLACTAAPVTAADLRSRDFSCAGSGMTFSSTITPR